MSYLARLKHRLHRDSAGSSPTEPTEAACVGSVGESAEGSSQIQLWLGSLGLLKHSAPVGSRLDQWVARVEAAEAFTRRWAATASQLGWSDSELFSLHPLAPLQRLDAMGAAFLTAAGRTTAVTRETIALEAAPLRFLAVRRPTLACAPAWETFCSVRTEA